MATLRLVLGDQLNRSHSWYDQVEEGVVYALMEMRQETDYVVHHRQKVLAFFGAMRRHAAWLEDQGHQVHYLALDDKDNTQQLTDNLDYLIATHSADKFAYQLPDEHRLDEQLRAYADSLDIDTETADTEHFFTTRQHFAEFFQGKKWYVMENFYRHWRKQTGLLMNKGEPEGGEWNYDVKNRKKWPKKRAIPKALLFDHDVSDLDQLLEQAGVKTLGTADAERLPWPLDRPEALELLEYFCSELLPAFGTFQDAMVDDAPYLHHSRLSFALNVKLLSPLEVCQAVEAAYRDRNEVDIAQAEGFIRQILGWREYMRGVYWAHMPDYANHNFFEAKRQLPSWYWTGDTHMRCMSQSIGQSLSHAYAHHIQRLMLTGNFAMLAGVNPDEVDAWYLGIYIDAVQWVELPNTRGMATFADGGIVGSKPYAASANYVNKMSHYCGSCAYDHKKKTGEGACPFNSLYWAFYHRNREQLERNPRIGMAFRTWDKMGKEKQQDLLNQAEDYLQRLDEL